MNDPAAPPIDVDALVREVKERVRQKRERGIYGPEVDAALARPLPGGALFTDDAADPLSALPAALDATPVYDPTSRKRGVGLPITFARRTLIWLIRWYVQTIVERQDRINGLVLRALQQLDARSSEDLIRRVGALESNERRRAVHENAPQMDYSLFAELFGGLETQVRAQAERHMRYFTGCTRVLDIGSGRGTFLKLAKENGIGAYGVEIAPKLIERCAAGGLEVYGVDAEQHLHGLPDASLDGIYAVHFAEHVLPGHLFELIAHCRRVLRPGSHLVMVTPNPRTLTVGAHSFWLDPTHRKPLPPDAFRFYLQHAGFEPVTIDTYNQSEPRLSEEGLTGAALDNVRLLNETLFGDRDYAVIGRKPE